MPTKQDLSALETPPSLQELSDKLYEKVYAGQDPAAAVQPADPGQSISIGYANWPVVQDAVRDDVLCRTVAAGAADRAKDEGQQNDDRPPLVGRADRGLDPRTRRRGSGAAGTAAAAGSRASVDTQKRPFVDG